MAVIPISLFISELIARSVYSAELARRRLAELAIRDPLTGLHNRRYFDDVLRQLFAARERLTIERRTPLAVIAFDLDQFGALNRMHGHEAGDVVLQRFGSLLAEQFRAGDLVARVGGEEFTVVMAGASASDAVLAADRVRELLEDMAVILLSGEALRVTVSAGCSTASAEFSTPAELLRAADVALSMAKRAGRNQVVSA